MTPCNLVEVYQRFGRMYCFYLRVKIRQARSKGQAEPLVLKGFNTKDGAITYFQNVGNTNHTWCKDPRAKSIWGMDHSERIISLTELSFSEVNKKYGHVFLRYIHFCSSWKDVPVEYTIVCCQKFLTVHQCLKISYL